MEIKIRSFSREDVPLKVEWINDSSNNQYLHYDLPLKIDSTLKWFENLKNRNDRADYTILFNEIPVGIIGLLNIDLKNHKAEYYITLGDTNLKGKGIAFEASQLLLEEAKRTFGLKKVYLYTEVQNVRAQSLFEKLGFEKEGLLRNDIMNQGEFADRYVYGLIFKEESLK